MSKNNKKRNRITKSTVEDDNGSVDDGVSTCSTVSDLTSIYDETETGYSTANESVVVSDLLDDQLDNAIEDLRNKNFKTRENALKRLQTLFCQKFLSELVSKRCDDLVDVFLSSLRRGSEIEGTLAASVTSLFIIQLGEQNEDLFQRFRDVLLPIIRDESKPTAIRAKFSQTLGLLGFLLSEDPSSTIELMNALEKIFSRSYLLDDGAAPMFDPTVYELHTAALASWCLLFSTLSENFAHEFIRLYVPEKIPGLIQSHDADLRNQAGEVIAVLYEIAREIHSIFAEPPESLLILLDEKAKVSAKYKGKKEKRLQRATFREIYNSFEDGTTPNFEVKFGRETLQIQSWRFRLYYNLFSNLLGSGITVHLRSNTFLRSIFELNEAELFDDDEEEKSRRFDRQLANKVAFKLRTQQLNKTRANKALRYNCDD